MKRRSFFQRVQDLPKPTRILRRVVEVFAGHAIYLSLLSALLLQPVLPLLVSCAEAATPKTPSTPGRATAPLLQTTIYGPVRFDRQAGTAENVIRQFSVPGPLAASYMLRIENGTSGAANRATGVILLLNGTLLTTSRLVDNGVAALDIPVQLLSNNELSIRVTGAPGSYVTVSIFIPSNLSISTFTPTSGYPGASVTISGTGFNSDTPNQNVAYFTASGGGFVFAPVTAYTSTSLTVTVPADAATGPVKVQTPDGSVVSAQSFTIVSGPYISGFTPTSGPIGATVTITGTNLKPDSSAPAVTFTGSNSTRIPALVSSSTATQVLVTVPNGVITGPIELTTSAGKTTSTSVFSVQASQDFAITLAPATAMALQGGQATFLLTLTSDDPNFTQMATLSAPSLPSGIKASFNPAQITSGGSSTVTMVIPGNISSGGYDFTFEAKALVDGSEKTKTTNGSLTVNIAAQTTLSGRVLANDSVPIHGATVSIDGLSAVTDSAGNFLLSGLTAGTKRPLMVDGRTAYAPNRSYPVIAEPVTIVAGQANIVPYTFYLPVVDTASEVPIVPSVTTNVTTPQVPGLTMTIPANAGLINRDGTPVTRASITPVEIDRTPAPLPPNVGTSIVFTAQPGGARPAQGMNVTVTYPNLGGANPGTRIALWNFNHDTVQWYIYGYGQVSADGRLIMPEPGVSLPDFSWHFPELRNSCDGGNCCKPEKDKCDECPTTNNPVDLSSGLKIEKSLDISFSGARDGLALHRIYTTNLAVTCTNCPFGRGWNHSYNIRLSGAFNLGGAGRILWPSETVGRLFSYEGQDSVGNLIFTTNGTPHLQGDKIIRLTNNTFEYLYKNGGKLVFDSLGRLKTIIDQNNNATTLAYDSNNLILITDPVGRSLSFNYMGTKIIRITDLIGRQWRYTYNSNNLLTEMIDPLDGKINYTYNSQNRIVSVRDKMGIVVKRISYDSSGRVIEEILADGNFERFLYTFSGNMITSATTIDSLGRSKSLRFNGAGQVVGIINEIGQNAGIKRDIITNQVLTKLGPCGCNEEFRRYDNNGNILIRMNKSYKHVQYNYDSKFNNIIQFTDYNGNPTNMEYDTNGNLTKIINPLGYTTQYSFNAHGQIISRTDALGHTTYNEYDIYGNLTSKIDSNGNRNSMEYDQLGRLISSVDPLGRRVTITYDQLDRVVTHTNSAGARVVLEYDANSNIIKKINDNGSVWTRSYDNSNRLTSYSDPLNRTWRYSYNKSDRIASISSPGGQTTNYDYDLRGLLISITVDNSARSVMRFTYNSNGALASISDYRGHKSIFVYDELNRLIQRVDPTGASTLYKYDNNNQLINITDRLGRKITLFYDSLGRRYLTKFNDAIIENKYDAIGRVTEMLDSQGYNLKWEYDIAGRLISETSTTGIVSYYYNVADELVKLVSSSGNNVTYGYDTAGRINTISDQAGSFTYTYDNLSRISRLTRPNQVSSIYDYNQANNLIKIRHVNKNNLALLSLEYEYNNNQQISAITSMPSSVFSQAIINNSLADKANRIPSSTQQYFLYNPEGQLIKSTSNSKDTTYDWDARGRLTKVILPNNETIKYNYDSMNRRVATINSTGITRYLYHGKEVISDENENGITMYLGGIEQDEKLLQRNTQLGDIYFIQDHIMNIKGLLNTDGYITEMPQYSVFGESNGSSLTRYTYTGREYDYDTKLLYYRARWYDPKNQRFISEDPIRYKAGGSYNFYTYANNNPISLSDPSGLKPSLLPPDTNYQPEAGAGVKCDGINLYPWIHPTSDPCLVPCMIVHENSHIEDAMKDNPYICIGEAEGSVLSGDSLDWISKSERKAYIAEFNCIKVTWEKLCKDDKCKSKLLERSVIIEVILENESWKRHKNQ